MTEFFKHPFTLFFVAPVLVLLANGKGLAIDVEHLGALPGLAGADRDIRQFSEFLFKPHAQFVGIDLALELFPYHRLT